MSLPRLAVRRPVAVAMLWIAVVLVGAVSVSRMGVALLPDVAFPRLVVWTTLPEIGPVEVERFVSEPVEEALTAVPGVRSVESVSREGQSLVTLTFPWGTDMEFARLHVRERLDTVADALPGRAERPTILRVDPGDEPILVASVTAAGADASASRADLAALSTTVFRRRLEQLDGIGRARVVGEASREIRVAVDPERLAAHGLAIGDVAEALARANASAPGGTIRRGRYRYALRALGELRSVEEIAATVVARGPGSGTVTVADVAAVRDTVAEREASAWFDGRPSVGILVHREADANTVAAADEAEATFEQLETEYPGIRLDVVTSQSTFVTAAIRSVVGALVAGGLLAFLVLFPFLGDPRWPAAIGIAIPVSVAGALALLHAAGVSLNVLSLGGLALGVGLLVDNSIVVLENVFRHRELGASPAEAAAAGTDEVRAAITASTLTTIAVFGPVVYVEGIAGALFGELALAVAFSLLVSLAAALTLLPALAARFGRASHAPRRSNPAFDRFDRAFAGFAARYERALGWALDHRREVLAASGAALLVALALGTRLPRNVLPEVDPRTFTVRIELPPGTPLEETEATALALDRWLRARDDVEAVLARVGRASSSEVAAGPARGRNAAVLDVRLSRRGAPTREVAGELRAAFAGLPPGALALETGAATGIGRMLGTGEADVAVELTGAGLDPLRRAAEVVAGRLAGLDRLADVRSTFEAGHPEVRIALDREAMARHGLAVERVVTALVDRTRGRVATEVADFDRKVPVVVRPSVSERADLDRLLDGAIAGVPLRSLVRVEEMTAPAAVTREGQRRVVRVEADVVRGGLAGAIGSALEGLPLPPGVEAAVGGGGDELGRSLRGLAFAFLLALVLVYLILAAQFESLVQPVVVLLAVPLAMVGAIVALGLTGHGLDTMSGIGIVVLVGIAVNDAILKVDTANRVRAGGLDPRAAIEEAGRLRLRPVVMTTATTILGLLPLALGIGAGSELRAPLAVAVIGGLVTSTALTLLVVPVLYSLTADA